MKIFIMILIGVAGGIIGGMGMGGGTLLIPLLVIFTDVTQHGAQAINLAAFVPMSVVALIIHFRNKLVDVKKAVWIAVPATVTAVFSSLLADKADGKSLGRYFGVFLLALGVYQLCSAIADKVKKKRMEDRK
ncbi:MAG: sulfite exporter TauE/SafE family protein [Firmicutes bacterium]|nr:sulfite exporter TauE/SafE family protein [Bacillota bacterium]